MIFSYLIEGKDTTIIGKGALGLPKDSIVNLVYGGRKHYTHASPQKVNIGYGGSNNHYTHGSPQDRIFFMVDRSFIRMAFPKIEIFFMVDVSIKRMALPKM